MVDFKNQQNFTAVLVKQKKTCSNTTQFLTLLFSVKIKETPRAFTAIGVLTTHYENNQNKNTTI